jgi:hypothetical protein
MPPQQYNWTCSVCSFQWVLGATGTANPSRQECLDIIGYPTCVNPTYGCMSAQCLIDAYATFGLLARQAWVTFDQAYALARVATGQINPQGMYHFMGIRGTSGHDLHVANSSPGYMNVTDVLSREQFNALGPVSVIYLEPRQPQ